MITLIFFLILNILIVLTWPIYSNLSSKKHSYLDEQKELLNLSDEELIILNNETWKSYHKFRFVPFIGHSETDRIGKFVNFTEKNGREVKRPENCVNNVYIYGGSTTFGYNVTDNQTLGYYLQEIVGDTHCVYNHGRAYYYSKQENNLFINHLEEGKKIDTAFFLDGINERCGGYEYMNQINNSFSLLVQRPYLMWKISLKNFVLTLPIIQLYNSFFGSNRWIHDQNNNILQIENCESKIDLGKLYESRIAVRDSICKNFKINCYSILQPMAGNHGVQNRKLLSESTEVFFKKKYKKLSEAKGFIDFGHVFKDDISL